MARPEDLEASVERFFRAAEARDFETFADCFAPDAEVSQNGERVSVADLVKWAEVGVESVRYFDVRRIVCPDAVVEQHRAEVVLAGGTRMTPPDICVVFRFDEDARFKRVDEYAPLASIPR